MAKMLAAAETDFEAHMRHRRFEQRSQVGGSRRGKIDAEAGQALFEGDGLMRTDRFTAPPPEKGFAHAAAARFLFHDYDGRLKRRPHPCWTLRP